MDLCERQETKKESEKEKKEEKNVFLLFSFLHCSCEQACLLEGIEINFKY